MIKVTVISLGRLKEKYLQTAVDEYKKRLSRFCDLKIVELNPEKLPEDPSPSLIDAALDKERQSIEKHIPKNSCIISLCVEGRQMSSEELAGNIKSLYNMGKNICFIIGSSYGLSDKVKQASDLMLSFSKMTFPHQLFRVFLLEQIYRSFMINEGSSYHK